jgi:hypothetical protein
MHLWTHVINSIFAESPVTPVELLHAPDDVGVLLPLHRRFRLGEFHFRAAKYLDVASIPVFIMIVPVPTVDAGVFLLQHRRPRPPRLCDILRIRERAYIRRGEKRCDRTKKKRRTTDMIVNPQDIVQFRLSKHIVVKVCTIS